MKKPVWIRINTLPHASHRGIVAMLRPRVPTDRGDEGAKKRRIFMIKKKNSELTTPVHRSPKGIGGNYTNRASSIHSLIHSFIHFSAFSG